MAERRDPSSYRDFDEPRERLDAIVGAVRSKDATLEESLDLLEEGIALGLRATDLVERPDFTARERAELDQAEDAGAEGGEVGEAADGSDDADSAADADEGA